MAYVDVKRWSLGTVCLGSYLANPSTYGFPNGATGGVTGPVLGKIQFGDQTDGATAVSSVYIPHGMNVLGLEVFYTTLAKTHGPRIQVRKVTISNVTGDATTGVLVDYDATAVTGIAAGALAYTACDPSTTQQTNVGIRDGFKPDDGGTAIVPFSETLDVFLYTTADCSGTPTGTCWAEVTVLYT